jgi:hypothetical protein
MLLERSAFRQTNENHALLDELVKTAYASRNWTVFNSLVEKAVDLPILDNPRSGLTCAIQALEARAVEILVGQRGELEVDPQQRSLFYDALDSLHEVGESDSAREGFQRIWHILLEKGEDINRVDEDHLSPLGYVATFADRYACQTDLIQLCIDSGADIYQPTFGIWDPLLLVAFHGSPTSLRCLMTHAAKQPKADHWIRLDGWNPALPLIYDLEYICGSLSRGELITTQDDQGLSLIEKAADLDNERLTSQLLKTWGRY